VKAYSKLKEIEEKGRDREGEAHPSNKQIV